MWDKLPGLIADNLPKALIGLLIPLAQWMWTRYRAGSREESRKTLRARIAELSAQRDALNKVSDIPNAEGVLKDLNAEIQTALAELVNSDLSQRPKDAVYERSRSARWLLAFTPSGAWGWLLHSLFYVNIATVLLGFIGIIGDWGSGDEGAGFLGLLIFLLPAFFLRRAALRIDTRRQSAETRPSRPIFPNIVFVCAIFFGVCMWIYAAFGDDDEASLANLRENWGIALLMSAFFALTAICARGWARSTSSGVKRAPSSRRREALLLFAPSTRTGWLPITAWHLGWTAVMFAVYWEIRDGFDSDDAVALAFLVPVLGAHLLCAWKWGQSFRSGCLILGPASQAEPSPATELRTGI